MAQDLFVSVATSTPKRLVLVLDDETPGIRSIVSDLIETAGFRPAKIQHAESQHRKQCFEGKKAPVPFNCIHML